MRAKFINEIKRGIEGSGLSPIKMGKAAILKGYTYINQHWPFIDIEFLSDSKDRHIIPIINEIAKWDFNCSPESIIILNVDYTSVEMDIWIDNVLNQIETYRYFKTAGFDDLYTVICYSKEWRIGRVEIYKEYFLSGTDISSVNRTRISSYYLIET